VTDAGPDPFPELGEIVDDHTVRFRRLLPVPIDDAWARLATAEGLATWLGPADFDPVVGAAFTVRFAGAGGVSGEHDAARGVVTTVEAPALMVLAWHEEPGPDVDSTVRLELDPVGPQSRLILTHRDLPVERKYGYAAGWHQHLARLVASLEGAADPGFDDVRQVNLAVAYRTGAGPSL
jgi:uncharacterized protein YndB with AHSA1/START domain